MHGVVPGDDPLLFVTEDLVEIDAARWAQTRWWDQPARGQRWRCSRGGSARADTGWPRRGCESWPPGASNAWVTADHARCRAAGSTCPIPANLDSSESSIISAYPTPAAANPVFEAASGPDRDRGSLLRDER